MTTTKKMECGKLDMEEKSQKCKIKLIYFLCGNCSIDQCEIIQHIKMDSEVLYCRTYVRACQLSLFTLKSVASETYSRSIVTYTVQHDYFPCCQTEQMVGLFNYLLIYENYFSH